jgi:hypothetical protein
LSVLTAALLFPVTVSAMADRNVDPPDFEGLLSGFAPEWTTVASDADATALWAGSLATPLNVPKQLSSSSRKPDPLDLHARAEYAELAIRLTGNLLAWRSFRDLRTSIETQQWTSLKERLEETAKVRAWLSEKSASQPWQRAWHLATVVASLDSVPILEGPVASAYRDYAAAMERAYPKTIESDDSWLALAERDGASGVNRRLMEGEAPGSLSPDDRRRLAGQYVALKLRPALTAYAVAIVVRAETEAGHHVREIWQRLRQWPDRQRELKGFVRLCGTWQWTIHNHQNHQEFKTMMVFPALIGGEGTGPQAGPKPADIRIFSDAVYLRWEMQGITQEDSLLFSKEGQRLEGTFVNSAGAWGAITGKRIAPCPLKVPDK